MLSTNVLTVNFSGRGFDFGIISVCENILPKGRMVPSTFTSKYITGNYSSVCETSYNTLRPTF